MRSILMLCILLFSFLVGCSNEGTGHSQQTTTTTLETETFRESCPRGVTNDPYPGSCFRYVDANKDGFCDLGEQ